MRIRCVCCHGHFSKAENGPDKDVLFMCCYRSIIWSINMLFGKCWFCISSFLFLVDLSSCLILNGKLLTDKTDWEFLTRFCFRKSLAKMKFHFEYPERYCCQNILLYFDSQWKHVYPGFHKNCSQKESVLVPAYNQKILLSEYFPHSGCHKVKSADGKSVDINCGGQRSFVSVRARWWFIAVSNCKTTKGLNLRYYMEFTNGDTFWTKHFSADEQYILETDIVFLITFFVLLTLSLVEAKVLEYSPVTNMNLNHISQILALRKLFHYTYKLFLWSCLCEFLSLILYVAYYTNYGLNGTPNRNIKFLGQAVHYIGHIVFLIMLILLAKGWTVTRGRISSSGQVKLAVFSTLYCLSFVVLFIYERVIFDPGKVLYIYESPAGIGICVLRAMAWIWFCYATFFTLKHFPKKTQFYYPFWFLYSGWFIVGPVVVIFATYVLEDYQRERIVNGIEWGVSLAAHGIFLVLTRPAAANTNFPFHMRTCQIGISEPENGNVSNYEPGNFVGAYTTDTFSMFQASGTQRSEARDIYGRSSSTQNGTEIPMRTLTTSNLENSEVNNHRIYPPPEYTESNQVTKA